MYSRPRSAHQSPNYFANATSQGNVNQSAGRNRASGDSTPQSILSPIESYLPEQSLSSARLPYSFDSRSASNSAMQSPMSPSQNSGRPALRINPRNMESGTSGLSSRTGLAVDTATFSTAGDINSANEMHSPSMNFQPISERGSSSAKQTQTEDPPSWAGHKTKAGKERKRLPLACSNCRRKKIRCSGEHPICKHCSRSHIPCVYKVTTRKPAPRTDYMAMLDKRLKRMEDRVIKAMPKDEQRAATTTFGRAAVKPVNPNATTAKKRQAEHAFADDLSNWTKRDANNEGPKATIPDRTTASRPPVSIIEDGIEHLPPYGLQEHLTEVYFDYVYGQVYQLLHKPTFLKRLRANQVPAVLVLSVCAVAARFSTHTYFGQTTPHTRGEEWAAPAREICMRRYDTPNLSVIMCYLLLGLHEFGTCHGGRSWMFGGMAQRMAYALQLHKNLDPKQYNLRGSEGRKLPQTDRETRLRTMWACFMMDRFNSSGTNRPPFVAEQYIEVPLPIKESLYLLEVAGPTEGLEHGENTNKEARDNLGCSAFVIRIIAIWGNVVRYVNQGGRDQEDCPMWSEQSGYSSLNADIATFESSLPEDLVWTKDNLATHTSDGITNQFIFMHIVLRQVILTLNRSALPLPGAKGQVSKDMPHNFSQQCVQRLFMTAHEASELIVYACEHRVVAPFAGYSAYFSSTVHIQGLASRSTKLIEQSKQDLASNFKFLLKIRQYWGMFQYITEQLKDLLKRQTDARTGQAQSQAAEPITLFQYGDWFEKYPDGVAENTGAFSTPPVKTEQGSPDKRQDSSGPDRAATQQSAPSSAAPANVEAKKRDKRRKRVRSVSGLPVIGGRDAQHVSPPASDIDSYDQAGASSMTPTGPPRLMQHRTFPSMPSYSTTAPVDDVNSSTNIDPIYQRLPPNQIPFVPDVQHTVLDYMSNPALQNQQMFMSLGSNGQQTLQGQHDMISELDRQMVISGYTGMGAMPGHTSQNSMDGLLMSPIGWPTVTAETIPTTVSQIAPPDLSSWFMPFNHDPLNARSASGIDGLSMGASTGAIDFEFDMDALGALPSFSDVNGLVMDTDPGLGHAV